MTKTAFARLDASVRVYPSPTSMKMVTADAPRSCFSAFEAELDYICRSLRRLGVRRGDIEDMAQEVYLVLYRRWSEYDATRDLRPWLFSLVLGVASAYRRRWGREFAYTRLEFVDPGPHPEQAVQTLQRRALVIAALDRIPLKRRAVFTMHDIDQIPMREIASVLEIPVFTAYSRLRKARKEFKTAVKLLAKNGALP
jgi:RNA polymerase sigma-70 factor (ECF subfamily)